MLAKNKGYSMSDSELEKEVKEKAPSKQGNNLQDVYLNVLRKSKTPVTMFLIKGVKLQGIITWFDNFSVLLRRDGNAQLIYKHAISTIMPATNAGLGEVEKAFRAVVQKGKGLQEVFLAAIEKGQNPCTIFLVNGVMLQGEVAAYDLFCLLLFRDGLAQLVYKHAISTIQPLDPVNLAEESAPSEEDV
jgi:host factor-I protein